MKKESTRDFYNEGKCIKRKESRCWGKTLDIKEEEKPWFHTFIREWIENVAGWITLCTKNIIFELFHPQFILNYIPRKNWFVLNLPLFKDIQFFWTTNFYICLCLIIVIKKWVMRKIIKEVLYIAGMLWWGHD